jgi:hypothetical protein
VTEIGRDGHQAMEIGRGERENEHERGMQDA